VRSAVEPAQNQSGAATGATEGIFVAPFEQGEIGPELFQADCNMGLEGLVSKRLHRPYRAGRSPHWVKVKNRSHPAMSRVVDALSNASM
jgi:bifunctional non-homologous end joining protein LigD